MVFNKNENIFCDTTTGQSISKAILNKIINEKKDLKEFYLVKSPLILKENEKSVKVKLMKFTLQENFH